MEGSLESIFMPHLFPDTTITTTTSNHLLESNEELQFKLLCASMELEKAKAEEKLHESKLWELQELLHTIRKERDEAREECKKLQESLAMNKKPLHTNATTDSCNVYGLDSPHSFMISEASMVSSPSSFTLLQELEDHLNSDDFSPHSSPSKPLFSSYHHHNDNGTINASLDLQQALDYSFSKSCSEGEDLEALFDLTMLDQNLSFENRDLSLEMEPRKEEPIQQEQAEHEVMVDREGGEEDGYGDENGEEEEEEEGSNVQDVRKYKVSPKSSKRSLSRQSSSNSSSASVQLYQKPPKPSSALVEQNQCPTNLEATPTLITSSISSITPSPNPKSNPSPSPNPNPNPNPIVVCNGLGTVTSPAAANPTSPPTPPPQSRQAITPSGFRKVHLPEPPEADPRVMLSSLPERGKLLQAVMQAGPLLQTLLLAGPLPQWRHPPPPLNTLDIPLVLPTYNTSNNISSSPLPLPSQPQPSSSLPLPSSSSSPSSSLLFHTLPLCTYVPTPTPLQASSLVSTTRRRSCSSNPDPCSRSKKLRKLSPSGIANGSMIAMPRSRLVADGFLPHSSTIY